MNPREWRPRRLDELGFVGRGKSRHRPRNDPRLYGGPHPFIQTADIMAADPYIVDYAQTYSDFGLEQSKLWPSNTLCITIAGANTARTALLKFEACFPDSVVGFIPEPGLADIYFVKYSLDLMRNRFLAVTRGATQDNLSLDKLLSFPIPTPDIEVQRSIGTILSRYDDLIANCQRRIRVLDELARSLYREWFVHFRYPGHEKTPLIESPIGRIPKGWRAVRVADEFRTVLGGTPSRAVPEYWTNGSIPWINSGKVNDIRIVAPTEYITELALQKSAAKLMPRRTSVLAITGATLGQVSYLEIETSANQSVVGIIDPTGMRAEWLYLTIRERIHQIIKAATGGAQQHINKEVVNDTLLVLPTPDVFASFVKQARPVFELVAGLLFQIENLRKTRDILLPRLLSGQLPVEDAA
jgi:type I restriction enzyme S subunit